MEYFQLGLFPFASTFCTTPQKQSVTRPALCLNARRCHGEWRGEGTKAGADKCRSIDRVNGGREHGGCQRNEEGLVSLVEASRIGRM